MNGDGNRLARGDDVYIESPVIMTVVRLIAPFTFTYGCYLSFHGANAPGGAFQGGAVVGATVIMLAFAFGIAPTRSWIKNRVVTGLMAGGVLIFGALGLSGPVLDGQFLDHQVFYHLGLKKGTKWGIEAVEVGGIFLIVAGTIIGLFFITAAGFNNAPTEGGTV